MSEPYSRQTITHYLIGSLPEAETEIFDELSISDDEFAQALSAVEKDLIDAYVQGELTGTELERFESHYLVSSLGRDKVRFAQAFQDFAKSNAGARAAELPGPAPAKSVPERKRAEWLAALSPFNGRRLALNWGLGIAALVLVAAGGWLAYENFQLRQQMSREQARRDVLIQREQDLQKELDQQRSSSEAERELARIRAEREHLEQELEKLGVRPRTLSPRIASFVLAPPLRGAGQLPVLSVPAQTDRVAIRLELEPGDHATYRVALLHQANKQSLWRSGSLRAVRRGDGKALAVSFSAGLLNPQAVYVLSVSGVSPNGTVEVVGEYPFRVEK